MDSCDSHGPSLNKMNEGFCESALKSCNFSSFLMS